MLCSSLEGDGKAITIVEGDMPEKSASLPKKFLRLRKKADKNSKQVCVLLLPV